MKRKKKKMNQMEEINMEKKEKLIHFELNDWFAGRDYPEGEPFETWVTDNKYITDNEWCKKNKLVVLCGNIDMSINWCITATESWVKENCPQLLSDKAYDYIVLRHGANGTEELTEHNAYEKFLRFPNEDGHVYGRFGWEFPEYTEENFGVHYCSGDGNIEDWDDDDEEKE